MIHRNKIKLMRGFEVEWCKNIPITTYPDGSTDADIDGATYGYKRFATMKEARLFALEISKTSEWGTANIHEFEMVAPHREFPSLYETEYIGESSHVCKGDPVEA